MFRNERIIAKFCLLTAQRKRLSTDSFRLDGLRRTCLTIIKGFDIRQG
jgi:hypothetical protein